MAFRIDAFSFLWDPDNLFYAFPPFSVIGRLLRKVECDQAEVLLVAPLWPTQVWFPLLLSLLVAPPVLLPLGCLSLPQDLEANHPMGERLHLAGMIISGNPLRRMEFRQGLRHFYVGLGDMVQRCSTEGISIGGSIFVSGGRLIRFGRL